MSNKNYNTEQGNNAQDTISLHSNENQVKLQWYISSKTFGIFSVIYS